VWHTLPAIVPELHVAASPGGQVILQAAHLPTAGALHEAPVSGFLAFGFFFSAASTGLEARQSASRTVVTNLMGASYAIYHCHAVRMSFRVSG
jgi:hypothetical protein